MLGEVAALGVSASHTLVVSPDVLVHCPVGIPEHLFWGNFGGTRVKHSALLLVFQEKLGLLGCVELRVL